MEWTPTQVAALVRTQAETLSLIAEKLRGFAYDLRRL